MKITAQTSPGIVKAPIDEEAWTAHPDITFLKGDGEYTFQVRGETAIIPAKIENGKLSLFPERFAAHKRLQAVLGA